MSDPRTDWKDDANNKIIHDEIEEREDAVAEYLTKEISEDEARDDTEQLTYTTDTFLLNRDSLIVSKVSEEYGTKTYILFRIRIPIAEYR